MTGGDLVIELKADVEELKRSVGEMERRMGGAIGSTQAALAATQKALAATQKAVEELGAVVREGFGQIGKDLDRFVVHLDAHIEAIGELSAKVDEHEDRLSAVEAKVGLSR